MAKTHELGLSFKTVGVAIQHIGFHAYKTARKVHEAGIALEGKKWLEQPHFWHVVRVAKGTPLHHRAYSGEIDGEFRYSVSHVLRITPSRALVVGSWQPKPDELDETDMLFRATNMDHERADEQSTEFESAVVGLSTAERINLPLAPKQDTGTCCGDSCGCQ